MNGITVWMMFALAMAYAVACEQPEMMDRVIEILKGARR